MSNKLYFTKNSVNMIIEDHIEWLEECKNEVEPFLCQEKIESLLAVKELINRLEDGE